MTTLEAILSREFQKILGPAVVEVEVGDFAESAVVTHGGEVFHSVLTYPGDDLAFSSDTKSIFFPVPRDWEEAFEAFLSRPKR